MTQKTPSELPKGPWDSCSLLKDSEFLAWLLLALGVPKVRDQLSNLDWSSVQTPLDVECYVAGAAWSVFWRDAQIREDYVKLLTAGAPTVLQWWSEKIWTYTTKFWFFPSHILEERHLEAFLRGVHWRKKTSGLPTRTHQDYLQLVIGLAKEQPPKAFAKAFTKLFPDDRVEERVLVLSGHRSFQDHKRSRVSAPPPRGLLGSPWVSPEDRKAVTTKMPVGVLYGPMIGTVSSLVVEKKIRTLHRTAGNVDWLKRAQLGLCTVDSDKDLLPLLPAVIDAAWMRVIRDMIARRDLFEQNTQAKQVDTLRKAPSVSF